MRSWRRGLVLVLVSSIVAAGEVEELIADLGAQDAYSRKVAAEELVQRGAPAVPALTAIVKDKDSPLRRSAVEVLGQMGPVAAPAVPALADALWNPNAGLRLAAAETLRRIGPAAAPALPDLIHLGDQPEWRFSFAARDALAAIGPEAAQALLHTLVDGDRVIAEWASGVYFDLGARTVPAALRALKSDDPRLRAAGADALAAAGPNGIFGMQALIRALHDKTSLVRRRAALALGRLGRGAADAIAPLIALANDRERRAVAQALWALGAILRDAGEAAQRKPIPRTEVRRAIDLALEWLAKHQDEDGKWDCDGFDKHAPEDNPNGGPGGTAYDVGVTGLALLALLESGVAERHARAIRSGLRHLVSVQDQEGNFGFRQSQHYMYMHATATLALCETGRFNRDPTFREAAQRGLDYIARARNPDAGWRYQPREGKSDTSMTGWMVMCLKAGEVAGFRVDPEAFAGGLNWVRDVTDPKTGRAGYNARGTGSARPKKMTEAFPVQHTRAMTAEAVLIRLGAGQRFGECEILAKSIGQLLDIPPRWDVAQGYLDMYYWFQATRALYQVGGAPWRKWSRAASKVILGHQHPRRSGAKSGSWDPLGPWGQDGGRVYATALMLLCLESIAGYTRPFELELPRGPHYRPAILTLQAARNHADPAVAQAGAEALAGFELR
ncbi:MAG: HEAT repeat domain-containing protein [Planctomycetota bacterium]|jgi:HEAT repeat protein